MMDFLRSWLVGIVAAGLAASLAAALTPPGTVRRVVQLAGGLIVLLAVARPLTQAPVPVSQPGAAEWERQSEQYAKQATQAEERIMKKIIEEKTSAYIETEAKARGLSLQAVVEAETPPGEENPLPSSVRLITQETPGEREKNDFADWLNRTLNIPPARQRWEEGR